jgi:methyltransferase (TIGR00027 family)
MTAIKHVSDTALWVAAYRADESERKDALFRDPLARKLAGSKGQLIANETKGTQYTAWAVVIRTCLIDQMILGLLPEGIDTILNLGAGLDTRPYRLALPRHLRWIEVDFPHVIELKEEKLKDEAPNVNLERVRLDLSDREKRRRFFSDVAEKSSQVLVLTEGVLPYLSNEQVSELAYDLRNEPKFRFWIVDYFSNIVMRYLMS